MGGSGRLWTRGTSTPTGTRKESIEELSKEYRKQIDFVKWQIDKYQKTIREMASQTGQTEEHERKLAR